MPAEKIIIETKQPVEDTLLELAYIMKRLRETTIRWQEHYGSANRDAMRTWEKNADAWIKNHIKKA